VHSHLGDAIRLLLRIGVVINCLLKLPLTEARLRCGEDFASGFGEQSASQTSSSSYENRGDSSTLHHEHAEQQELSVPLYHALECLQVLHDEVMSAVRMHPGLIAKALPALRASPCWRTRQCNQRRRPFRSNASGAFVCSALTRVVARQVADVSIAFSGATACPRWLVGLAERGLFAGISGGMRRQVFNALSFGGLRALAHTQAEDDAVQTLQRAYLTRVLGMTAAPFPGDRSGE